LFDKRVNVKKNVIRVTESRSKTVIGHVACVGIWEIHIDVWLGSLKSETWI
jgi:hypothetical protein